MYKYENFEDWFDELEGFGMRSERCLSFFDETEQHMLMLWLRAAFDSARLTECP